MVVGFQEKQEISEDTEHVQDELGYTKAVYKKGRGELR